MKKTALKTKPKAELLKLAKRLGLRGISTMNKPELVDTISRAKQHRATPLRKRAAAAIKRRAVRKHNVPATKKPVPKKKAVPSKRKAPIAGRESAVAAAELSAHKFDVTSAKQPPKQVFQEEHLGELPESYGTGRLYLLARDPHWLFADWDLTGPQMADYRRQASDGRVVLRLFEKNHPHPIQEHTLAHDARNWYLQVRKAATTYAAEIGYWQPDGHFYLISRSPDTTTPSDMISADTTARFATIPVDVKYNELLQLVRTHVREGERLADTLHRLQTSGFQFPFQVDVKLGPWTAEQAAQLEHVGGEDVLRRAQVGSVELSEWLRRRLQEETSSGMFSGFSPAGASWSGPPQQGFWFAVNAELIIYGATEPDATVTVDGKPIKLRSDGTFSFHHSFPDGRYRLPVVAASAKNGEKRAVELRFERQSQRTGDIDASPSPAHLKAPATG